MIIDVVPLSGGGMNASYNDIIIDGNNFEFIARNQEEIVANFSVDKLEKIKFILEHFNEYKNVAQSGMSSQELKAQLASVAKNQKNYLKFAVDILSSDDQKREKEHVKSLYKDIKKLAKESLNIIDDYQPSEKDKKIKKMEIVDFRPKKPELKVLMPDDVMLVFAENLNSYKEVGNLRKINQASHVQLDSIDVRKARKYGYQGNDKQEAIEYMKSLFAALDIILGIKTTEAILERFFQVQKHHQTIQDIDHNKTQNLLDQTLLHAAYQGKLEICLGLIRLGANLDYKDKMGRTALHLAVLNKQLEAVKLLVEKGADINVEDNNLETPLFSSFEYSNEKYDTIEPEISLYLLTAASANKNFNVNSQDKDGNTLMIKALEKELYANYEFRIENVYLIDKLISMKADVNIANFQGETPLHVAVRAGNLSLIKSLIAKGAEAEKIINQQDRSGNTALHYAAEMGYLDLAKELIGYGADPNLENHKRKKPADEFYALKRLAFNQYLKDKMKGH
jgi:ankyrin repeat protein